MNKILYIVFITSLFVACKPVSNIVTSKEEAQKRGLYSAAFDASSSAKETTTTSRKIDPIKETLAEITEKIDVKPTIIPTKEKAVVSKKETKKALLKNENESDIVIDEEDTSYLVEQLINVSSENLGTAYRAGGTTKEGFDCSGLVFYTFQQFNIQLPHSSSDMAKLGRKVDLNEVKKGDLIFFINRGQKRINHVGMVVEVTDGEIKFIHSSTQLGVVISSLNEPYYKKTFTQVNRVLEN